MIREFQTLSAASVLLVSAATSFALADDEVIVNSNRGGSLPANLSEVRPFRNPLAPPPTSDIKAEAPSALLASGAMPPSTRAVKTDRRAYGSFGIPYTSTRVATGGSSSTSANPNYLATTYPYRAIGKLTFSAGYCSASLIRRSVLVTAAHCIQRFGTGTSLYSNFQFTPAQYSPGTTPTQVAPYGTWAWA